MVSAEGIESARQRKFNNMQGHGWHKKYMKSTGKPSNGSQTDCNSYRQAGIADAPRRQMAECGGLKSDDIGSLDFACDDRLVGDGFVGVAGQFGQDVVPKYVKACPTEVVLPVDEKLQVPGSGSSHPCRR
jgi:hypothetical protein